MTGRIYKTTKKLQGDIGELIFEHFCQYNQYAYIKLEGIYNSLSPNNKLIFMYGNDRIMVELPEEVAIEASRLCKPTNKDDHQPYFVFDYLTVSLRTGFLSPVDRETHGYSHYCQVLGEDAKYHSTLGKGSFNWIEIKTGKGKKSKKFEE
jgi:hypothetical protein